MTTKELLKLIEGGLEPVIRFNSSIGEVDNGPDNGMLGRIMGVGRTEEDGGDKFVKVFIDVESFRDYNEKLDAKSYFDRENNHKPIGWFETEHYPEPDKYFELFEMVEIEGEDSEPLFFDLCDSVLINRFFEVRTKNQSYIEFLEDAARKHYNNELTNKLNSINN